MVLLYLPAMGVVLRMTRQPFFIDAIHRENTIGINHYTAIARFPVQGISAFTAGMFDALGCDNERGINRAEEVQIAGADQVAGIGVQKGAGAGIGATCRGDAKCSTDDHGGNGR